MVINEHTRSTIIQFAIHSKLNYILRVSTKEAQ